MDAALIHRVRQVGEQRAGGRDAQGSYGTVPFEGPWTPARVMQRGAVAAKSRRSQTSAEARIERGYEILIGPEDEAGAPIAVPTASTTLETDCPILGSPTIVLDGEPEILNNGDELIGYLCYGDVPAERS